MNNSLIYIAIGVVVFIVFKMLGNVGTKKISHAKAKEMMDNDVIILDVREAYEFSSGHIKNAINLPLGRVQNGITKVTSDKEKTILVYCLSGSRSGSAARSLHSLGYNNAHNIGGISSWKYGVVK